MCGITRQLRSIAIRAEVQPPDQWENAGTEAASLPEARSAPIALSATCLAPLKLARLLGDEEIPVETLVAIKHGRLCQ